MGLYLANVVFPASQDSTVGDLVMDSYLLAGLMAAGVLAQRVTARPGGRIIAGMAAGLVLAVLGMATFAVIDNAFLTVVSHQPAKIAGFQASGMTSMRAYLNSGLAATAPGVAIVLTVAGAVFAPLGAVLAQRVSTARSRVRLLPRR